MRRVGHLFRRLGWFSAAAAAVAAGGFLWFVLTAETELPPPPRADGIVVLTGGADRLEKGLSLLADGQAGRLLVSGVSGGADLPQLARMAGLPPVAASSDVEIGRGASTTVGNAQETLEWARRNDLHSLIVVTAGYHMPRALAELRHLLPDVTLYPAPVRPPALRRGNSLAVLRLLAGEFVKYVVAVLGLSRLMSPGLPSAAPLITRGGVGGGAAGSAPG